jgi:hypothetical protein
MNVMRGWTRYDCRHEWIYSVFSLLGHEQKKDEKFKMKRTKNVPIITKLRYVKPPTQFCIRFKCVEIWGNLFLISQIEIWNLVYIAKAKRISNLLKSEIYQMKNIYKPIFWYSKTNRIKVKNIFNVQMMSQQRLQYNANESSF